MAFLFFVLCIAAQEAGAVRWTVRGCEPPSVFYSANHLAGARPCCSTVEGVCPGGAACPPSGVCPTDGIACVPTPGPARPNVILMIADDLGSCHYGHAGECRSVQTGTPIPAPVTPNLDLLAGYGTTFPVAHNTAPVCVSSRVGILTGRYQLNLVGERQQTLPSIPRVLRSLGSPSSAPADPYSTDNRIGGYCTLLAGKFTAATVNGVFDGRTATSERRLGRSDCVASAGNGAPKCGTEVDAAYRPFTTGKIAEVFDFIDSLVHPDPATGGYAVQPFFVWYAPRMPHQPLSLKGIVPVYQYLFGAPGSAPLGGLMQLGRWCVGSSCQPATTAFNESNFGSEYNFYTNVWWADDNVRDIRRFLAAEAAPHCIGPDGRGRFDVTTPGACTGVWSGVAPDPARNTVLIHLADNGWFLPNSKHDFTENGYRTRVIVFDPRTLSDVPSWDPRGQTAPPARTSEALASGLDVFPTVVGLALGTPGSQACPTGLDGKACDGRDLRPQLASAPGGPAPTAELRHSLCGHFTIRPTSPTRLRYLLTRPGSVGRCAPQSGAACASAQDCGPGQFCVGGLCAAATAEIPCSTDSPCPAGAVCLAGQCRAAPVCTADEDCTGLVGSGYACVGKEQRWCRNAPNAACTTSDDCPACPTVNGFPVPCERVCEARSLKLYLAGAGATPELTDLFLDPDERGLHNPIAGSLVQEMTQAPGYANAIRRLSCCIDGWWDGGVGTSSPCTPGFECPSDLTCNQ